MSRDNFSSPHVLSIILCCAPADDSIVCLLADFLKANLACAVSRTEAVVGSDLDLIEATERALSADVALVLLSPASVPKVWPGRSEWEHVFVDQAKELQTRLGFVLVDACNFPSGLRRQHFFDASRDPLTAAREIKRWLLRPDRRTNPQPPLQEEDLEGLRRAVADQPGSTTDIAPESALQFALDCSEEFEAVYRFDCRARSRAGIAGDIGSALGLRMSGKLEQNRATLTEWGATRRVLFVLAGVGDEDREFATLGGLTSTIFITSPVGDMAGAISSRTADAVRTFHRCAADDDNIHLGRLAVSLLEAQQRYTEMLELLDAMGETARCRGDRQALLNIDWERYWVCNKLDFDDAPAVDRPSDPQSGVQLFLPFAE